MHNKYLIKYIFKYISALLMASAACAANNSVGNGETACDPSPTTMLFETQKIYTSIDVLLAETIKQGTAAGVISGAIAEHFARELRSRGPLLVNARVISPLKRTDCKRIEVVYIKKEVQTLKGPTEAILKMKLDYCLDGGPPEK